MFITYRSTFVTFNYICNMDIGTTYYFKFAGSILEGKLIKIKTTYGDLTLYVFKSNDGFKYPVELKEIIKQK